MHAAKSSPSKIVYASQLYAWRRSRWLVLTAPIVVYGFLTVLHNMYGVDVTGGWLGTSHSHPAHLTVLVASPFFFMLQMRALRDLLFRHPKYLQFSESKFTLWLPERRDYYWNCIVDVSISESGVELIVRVKEPNKNKPDKISIPVEHLDATIAKLARSFEAHGLQVANAKSSN